MNLYENQAALLEAGTRHGVRAITLRSGLADVRGGLPYLQDFLKLAARSLAHPAQTRGWLALLNSEPQFGELVGHCPRMVHKIYRPYLSNKLDCAGRLRVLTEHYRFVAEAGLSGLVARASRNGVLLAALQGKSGAGYEIVLRAVGTLEREGELVLQLTRAGELLYSVAFTFSGEGGRKLVSIGCLQGSKAEDALAYIREATRDLHGLRPKNLMVSLVRQLGHALGCSELHLAGNRNRVVHSALRKGLVAADYDQLWRELGAGEMPDGDFRLGCEALRLPDLEQVPSKRRSEVRKRHELVEGVFGAISDRLAARAPGMDPFAYARNDAVRNNWRNS